MNIGDIKVQENSKFLTLTEGENPIRIVSGFIVREVEYKDGKHGVKYCAFVIDRKDGKIKIASFGTQIIKKIQKLAASRETAFVDVPKYDMIVVREGTGQFDTNYDVIASRTDTELTSEEVMLVAALPPIENAFNPAGELNVDDIPF